MVDVLFLDLFPPTPPLDFLCFPLPADNLAGHQFYLMTIQSLRPAVRGLWACCSAKSDILFFRCCISEPPLLLSDLIFYWWLIPEQAHDILKRIQMHPKQNLVLFAHANNYPVLNKCVCILIWLYILLSSSLSCDDIPSHSYILLLCV